MKKIILKYFAEFLVVFLGILLSFFIDNSIKLNSKVENKNQLLLQLSEVIEKDLEQLKVIDSTLLSVENSLDYLIDDLFSKQKVSSKALALNFENVSWKMSLSFFPNSGVYNEIISDGAMKLIKLKTLRSSISLIYEHNSKRSQAVNRSLDDFNEEFNRYFYPYIQFRTKEKNSKTIYSDTELIYYKVNSNYILLYYYNMILVGLHVYTNENYYFVSFSNCLTMASYNASSSSSSFISGSILLVVSTSSSNSS